MRLIHLQAVLALFVSVTHAVHVGIVISWGTRSHVTPLFDGLRPMANSSLEHRITYLASAKSASFASNHLDFVHVENSGVLLDVNATGHLIREMSQTETPIAPTVSMARVFDAIGRYYEDVLQMYSKLFRSHKFDLIICDFFDRACMDAALESGTTFANVGNLGSFGAGDAWFVPDMMFPVSMETWIRSPLVRVRALWNELPVIKVMAREELRTKAIRDALGFQTSSTYMDHFRHNLFLCHNIIGLDAARSIPPNMVVVGSSLDEKTMPQLQPELEDQLQQFENDGISVAYIAFGTAVSLGDSRSVYTKMIRGVDDWSSRFHDTAMIKEIHAKHPGRFLTPKWVEQRRLLLHNAVKVFMSHGGYGSSTEALFAGKPLVMMPFFGDQFANANNAEAAGVAVQLDKFTFTSDEMVIALASMAQQFVDPTSSVARSAARMKTIVRLNSEMGKVVLTNTVLMAATVGTSHLVPRDVYLSIFDRFPLWFMGGVVGVLAALGCAVTSLLMFVYQKLKHKSSKIKQL